MSSIEQIGNRRHLVGFLAASLLRQHPARFASICTPQMHGLVADATAAQRLAISADLFARQAPPQ
jgi:hypothetical protein